MKLRQYQLEAVTACYEYLRTRDDNPVICLPTGAGKSLVIAQICRDVVREWNGRILVCSHVREILDQNASKIQSIDQTLQVGVYCAGMGRRDRSEPIIVASIQSIFKKACDFLPFDLLLIDECHLLSPDSNSMYQKLIADMKIINPLIRVIGTTATPFRLSSGMLCGPNELFGAICYEAGIKELIRDGYLCPLKSRNGVASANMKDVHIRGGEFVADEAAAAFDQDELVSAACLEIVELAKDRKSILVFCSSVDHAQHVADNLRTLTGERVGFIVGETPSDERDETLKAFKEGQFRFLCNCNVLTTGMDAPHIDAIVLLRATLSPGLFAQMCGRGFRLSPNKTHCDIYDFGGNVLRHGTLDNLRVKDRKPGASGTAPVKECPSCNLLIHASYSVCPECGHIFPAREAKHGTRADGSPILSGEITDTEFDVRSVRYCLHRKKDNPDAPPTLRVDYNVGWEQWKSEWVCIEHEGFARTKAEQWWALRTTLPFPDSVAEAVRICQDGGVATPTHITVREISGERFPRIIKVVITEKFEPGEAWESAGEYKPINLNMGGLQWWELLGVRQHDTIDVVEAAYKKLARKWHPDQGGDHETMVLINAAYEKATEYLIPF